MLCVLLVVDDGVLVGWWDWVGVVIVVMFGVSVVVCWLLWVGVLLCWLVLWV